VGGQGTAGTGKWTDKKSEKKDGSAQKRPVDRAEGGKKNVVSKKKKQEKEV